MILDFMKIFGQNEQKTLPNIPLFKAGYASPGGGPQMSANVRTRIHDEFQNELKSDSGTHRGKIEH